MKNLLRNIFCAAGMALVLSTCALAAEPGSMILISPKPNPVVPVSDIAIEWNGEPLTFTDAVPQIVNDRTYLPFRTVFTALGFADEDITYEGESKTVCASSGELTISMVIGESKVSVTRDGETTVMDTDAPVFIDPKVGRTYVPARFVAEAAGYRVGWNGDTRTVIIDDVDAILDENQESYQILDLYLDYSRKFQKKNYDAEGTYSANLVTEENSVGVEGTYTMRTSGGKTFDLMTLMKLKGTMDGEDLAAALPEGVDLELRGDMDAGVFYFKSNALMTGLGSGAENLWFQGDLPGTDMGQTGMMSVSKAITEDMNGKACIDYAVRMMAQTDTSTSAADSLALLNALLGDRAFTKVGGKYQSSLEMEGLSVSMLIPTKNGRAVGYALTCHAGDEAAGTGMEVIMEGERLGMGLTMQADGMRLEMCLDGTYTTTNKKPSGQPPEGAAVMELAGFGEFPAQ